MMKIALVFLAVFALEAHAQHMDRNDRAGSDDRARPADWRADDDERYRGDDIQLLCFGQAEQPTTESHNGYQWNQETHKYEPKSELVTGKRDFDTSVKVSIHDDQGRIHMPKQLIPPLHSGGSDGWWNIEDLIIGHNEIRGRFRLNGLNKPSIVIDRRSGAMTVDGLIKFNGRCEPDSGHRRF